MTIGAISNAIPFFLGQGFFPNLNPSVRQPNQSPGSADPGSPAQPTPNSRATDPITTTAYQRNQDGDDVTLTSRQDDLTEEEQQEVEKLQARDAEVRQHEQAHVAAAGPLFRGGPYYDYETGPDGNRYVVGGSVSIDTSDGRTPEETIQKAEQAIRSALAPAEPSSTDLRVAAEARQRLNRARTELNTELNDAQAETEPVGAAPASPTEAPFEPGATREQTPFDIASSSRPSSGASIDVFA